MAHGKSLIFYWNTYMHATEDLLPVNFNHHYIPYICMYVLNQCIEMASMLLATCQLS